MQKQTFIHQYETRNKNVFQLEKHNTIMRMKNVSYMLAKYSRTNFLYTFKKKQEEKVQMYLRKITVRFYRKKPVQNQ